MWKDSFLPAVAFHLWGTPAALFTAYNAVKESRLDAGLPRGYKPEEFASTNSHYQQQCPTDRKQQDSFAMWQRLAAPADYSQMALAG
jgi:hypothetical protein